MNAREASAEGLRVSVVVIGRNEGLRLTRCLDSVREIRMPDGTIELIYVDSASTDNSVEQAKSFGAQVIIVDPRRPCAAIGRNAGWRAARGSIVLFLDGDTVLAPDFVPCGLRELDADPRIGVVFGYRRELYPDISIYNRVLDLDWIAESLDGLAFVTKIGNNLFGCGLRDCEAVDLFLNGPRQIAVVAGVDLFCQIGLRTLLSQQLCACRVSAPAHAIQ